MSNFLKHIIAVIIITIASAYLLESVYTYAFTTGFSRNKTQYVVQLKDTHIDYIFLGSSRVENHIDCELVTQLTGKSCINLGLQASKTNDSAALLQILEDNNVTYDQVLFQLDYAVNFDSYAPAFISSIAPYQNTKMISKDLKEQLEMPSIDLPFVRYAANDKMIGLREVVLQLIQKPSKVNFNNGFLGIDRVGTAMKGILPQTVTTTNRGVQIMKEVAPTSLLFYTAPYCKSDSNRDVFIKELQKIYPEVISYIDLFDSTESYFADCGHLNREGATAFTKQLTADLLLHQSKN